MPDSENSANPFKYSKTLLIGCFLLVSIIFAGLINLLVLSLTKTATAPSVVQNNVPKISQNGVEISGTLNLNGTIPEGAAVSLYEKTTNEADYHIVVSDVSALDGAVWKWKGAEKGVEYSLKASLSLGEKIVAESKPLVVTAPALDEVLTINVSANETAKKTSISGTIDLNGYVPPQSTIEIQEKKSGETSYKTIITGIKATDGASWSWDSALAGDSYEIKARLLYGGKTIGESPPIFVSGQADGEVLIINSTNPSPASSQTSISGTVNVNGPTPGNSSIVIKSRVTGTSLFNTILTNIAVTDGVSWNWTNAIAGNSYDLMAYVVDQNGNSIVQSQLLTVSAPAANEKLTFNIGIIPPQPTNAVTNTCISKNQQGLWQVKFSYNNTPLITNALGYWLTVGTSSGGNQILTINTTPDKPAQTQFYTSDYLFKEGTNYFVQYAYSTCSQCYTYSPFSSSIQFNCAASPTPTNSPVPTNTPTIAPTAMPTLLPTEIPEPTVTPIDTPVPAPTN